ncbi:MAG: FMN-binding protein [Eggerthellaceae bacterium]|nr:FMN-binding protein [Eggerthellaceae bacterium]
MKKTIIALVAAFALAALVGCGGGGGAAAGKYTDGTYTGSGMGKEGAIEVTLSIAGDKITVDNITDPGETPGIGGAEAIADGTFKKQIEDAQSAEIDGVTGATLTSDGVKAAVTDALNQASGGAAATSAAASADASASSAA